jgi:hypothetical protein
MPLDILAFVRKWNASTLTERSGAPQHFRDLCDALDVPHPTEEDQIGTSYTFEKRVAKTGGGEGFADVWKRGFFAWEYKSKGGDLKAAYKQLNEYHEALENPPLLVVCDFVRFEVHTKFENLPSRVYSFTLDDLLLTRDTPTSALPPLEVLRHVFGDFNLLHPNLTSARVTEAAATDFLRLAQRLELERAAQPDRPSKEQIAHFLMRLVFCLFADSVNLLPNHAFRRLVESGRTSLRGFNRKLPVLFEAMSEKHGFFGADDIRYFNGGLFTDNVIIELDHADIGILISAANHDWSHIEPAIFGTLFERSLDEAKRSLIGAHYTSKDDILLLVEPVIMQPLLRRWEIAKSDILSALAAEEATDAGAPGLASETWVPTAPKSSTTTPSASGATLYQHGAQPHESHKKKIRGPEARPIALAKTLRAQPRLNLNRPALNLLQDFATELTAVRILDPACGSGNFLYVALKRLLDLWAEARNFGLQHGLSLSLDPMPNPTQLFGIETDFYAHEIASIVVWIGFLQWKHDHGIHDDKEPLLQKLDNIEHGDAIMRYDPEGKPYEPTWPSVGYIVGNPPFLGGKFLRRELGDHYVDDLFRLYENRVKAESDLVVYWFEKARHEAVSNDGERAGLLATQAIRKGANRFVLEQIAETADIFWAHSNREWVLEGAAVRISMVGFIKRSDAQPMLNGEEVAQINPDLTSEANTTSALPLIENDHICFQGTIKVGDFELSPKDAARMLGAPINPNGKLNPDVVVPWINASDVTGRKRGMFIIDFGAHMTEHDAALYEWPFEYLRTHVKPIRDIVRRKNHREKWWLHAEARPGMRNALLPLRRFIVTPRVAKHRFFVWEQPRTLPDSRLFVFARDDDYFFGSLHSSIHEAWSLATSSRHGDGEDGGRPTYGGSATFDTYPFPWPPGTEPSEKDDPRVQAIAAAARELVRLRDAWLNPEKPAAVEPKQWEADLKKRTLTNLYNERPTWLANAHRTLDEAVFAAYGWPSNLTTQEILARLLALNHERATSQGPGLKRLPKQ